MKKNRIFSLLLLVVLLLTLLCPSVLAAETTTTEEAQPTETTQASEATQPTDETQSAPTEGKAAGVTLAPDSELLPELATLTSAPAYTVKAKAALLIELNSGTIVYSLNADAKMYPASLTKIMTCMLALDYGNLDDTVTASATALANLDENGSTADIIVGEQMSLRNLLYCMMLSSANESCRIVAEYIAGSESAFVELMNQKAAALGCTGTHFANPHGLHDENHYTTARDLSIITRKALQSQTFREITSTANYTVPATNKSDERELVTTNFLLSRDVARDYYYEYATGVKTGFTTPAGRCLIATAAKGNLKYLSVLLGGETELLEDGSVLYHNFSETKSLLDYGFDSFDYAQVISKLNPVAQVPVSLSAGADSVVIVPSEDIQSLLPNDYDASRISTQYELDAADGLVAPLDEGQIVGTITAYYNGTVVGETTVQTLTSVARSDIEYTFEKTKTFAQTYWWLIVLLVFVVLLLIFAILLRVRAGQQRKRAAERHNRRTYR